jgi:hypothetical protein
VSEDAAPRLIQDELAELVILCNEGSLLPEGFSGRGWDAADNDVAYLAFSMATDDVDDL